MFPFLRADRKIFIMISLFLIYSLIGLKIIFIRSFVERWTRTTLRLHKTRQTRRASRNKKLYQLMHMKTQKLKLKVKSLAQDSGDVWLSARWDVQHCRRGVCCQRWDGNLLKNQFTIQWIDIMKQKCNCSNLLNCSTVDGH